jgi:antirestriction protein ArdC
MSKEGQDKIYQMVTDKMVAALEAGTVPWRKPWKAGYMLPQSMSTKNGYRGINNWLLLFAAEERGFTSPFWGTSKRIAELGGKVKADEWKRGTIVIFWKRIVVRDDTAEDGTKLVFLLRYYRVYNAEQAEGLPERYYPKPAPFKPADALNEDAELLIKGYLSNGGPKLHKERGDLAAFHGPTDTVTLPLDEQFSSHAARYDATFHEFAHSTGHKSRLNRPGVAEFDHFGSDQYAREELVAQMTAAMLDAVVGNEAPFENSAAYVANWLAKFRNDNRLVIQAAASAQKAADHIRGIKYDSKEE